MSYLVERKLEVKYHPYAECVDCVWKVDSGPTVRDAVKKHVRALGHEVRVTSEIVSTWGPKFRIEGAPDGR